MGNTLDMSKGSIVKVLLVFAVPILIGSLFQQLYLIVDAMIVGNLIGSSGLAAIDSVNAMLRLPMNFFTGLSTGATILISRHFGEHDYATMSDSLHTGVVFSFVGGAIISLLGVIFAPQLIHIMDVPADIYPMTLMYVRVYFGGIFITMLYNMCAGILRALGNSKATLYALIVASFINIVLDYIFVGIFKMGVGGAALATIIAQFISAVILLKVMSTLDVMYAFSFKKLTINKQELLNIIRLGSPIGLQSSLYPIANMTIQSSVNMLGTTSIAVWAVMGKVDSPIWLICDAMCISVVTFIAQNLGAKEYERVNQSMVISLAMTVFFVAVASAILYFGTYTIGHLFVDDPIVLSEAARIMRVQSIFYVAFVFGDIFSAIVRGQGETFRPMIVSLFGTCISRILWMLLVVPNHHTLLMIDLVYPFSWCLNSLLQGIYFFRFQRQFKIRNTE